MMDFSQTQLHKSALVSWGLVALLGAGLPACGGMEGEGEHGLGKAELSCGADEIPMDGACEKVAEICEGELGQLECVVMTSPAADEARVGAEVTVEGVASFFAENHLWVLVGPGREGVLWWPQREISPDPETHQWSAEIDLNTRSTSEGVFSIALVLVDPAEQEHLEAYLQDPRGKVISGPPPIQMPRPVEDFQVRTVVVGDHSPPILSE